MKMPSFQTSQELEELQRKISHNKSSRFSQSLVDRSLKTNSQTQWALALLLYNICIAPMSSYCANNIFQYGVDVAKYNVISIVFKYLMKQVILLYCRDHL